MISANLLADIDVRMRKIRSQANSMKTNAEGLDRAFGGVNVLSSSWAIFV